MSTDWAREIKKPESYVQKCKHFNPAPRRRVTEAGTTYHWQCLVCGEERGHISVKQGEKWTRDAGVPFDLFDEELHPAWQASQALKWNSRREAYDAYLRSPEWAVKRALVLKRANGHCEGCGLAIATQVHHQTYDNVGAEFLWELAAVCRACHERVHVKESA